MAYNLSDVPLILGFEVSFKGLIIATGVITNCQAGMLADC